jgi:hypothetical protein
VDTALNDGNMDNVTLTSVKDMTSEDLYMAIDEVNLLYVVRSLLNHFPS